MAVLLQVTCIDKPNRYDPHSRIRSLAGVDQNGMPWQMTEDQAIGAIETGQAALYTHVSGNLAYVVVMPPRTVFGRKYLRTDPDKTVVDNLLHLPNC